MFWRSYIFVLFREHHNILWGRGDIPGFHRGNSDSERPGNLPKVTKLVRGKAETQFSWPQFQITTFNHCQQTEWETQLEPRILLPGTLWEGREQCLWGHTSKIFQVEQLHDCTVIMESMFWLADRAGSWMSAPDGTRKSKKTGSCFGSVSRCYVTLNKSHGFSEALFSSSGHAVLQRNFPWDILLLWQQVQGQSQGA